MEKGEKVLGIYTEINDGSMMVMTPAIAKYKG
jgi:hypothetical protein